MTRRVVITGLGAVTCVGHNVNDTWANIVNGVSGVAPITLFDPTDIPVKIAAEVKNFDPLKFMDVKEARRRDRYQQLATAAAREAVAQSGLQVTPENAERVGVIISSGVGGLKATEEAVRTLVESGSRRINPFTVPMLMSNGAAGLVSIDIGAQGPCFCVTSACASGADGIGNAWLLIRHNVADVVIAGASEASVWAVGIGAFDRLNVMTRRDSPENTPQPFDKNRDGLVMGEGAAILMLEELAHARARGAEILAELAGYGATTDSYHITAPDPTGAGSARAMQKALESARLSLDSVDYINAHGTSTPLNDVAETVAIKRVFGQRAYQIPISSTKSMTGHMMGATGALEAVFCVQAIRTNTLPPTIHYQTPDPECDLDYIPNTARQVKQVDVTLNNAFGFGGHNAVLAITRFKG